MEPDYYKEAIIKRNWSAHDPYFEWQEFLFKYVYGGKRTENKNVRKNGIPLKKR